MAGAERERDWWLTDVQTTVREWIHNRARTEEVSRASFEMSNGGVRVA